MSTFLTMTQVQLFSNAVAWGTQNPAAIGGVGLDVTHLTAIDSVVLTNRSFTPPVATHAFMLLFSATAEGALRRDATFNDAMAGLARAAGPETIRKMAAALPAYPAIRDDLEGLVDAAVARMQTSAQLMASVPQKIEDEVDAAWADKAGPLNRIKSRTDDIVREVVREYSLAVISPHNVDKIPIDADSFVAAAAIYRRLRDEAAAAGREIEVIFDAARARDDGKLYVLFLPISNEAKGFSDEERASLDIPHLEGKRAVFVADMRFYVADDFKRRGTFGFDLIFVQDHHKWNSEYVDGMGNFGDDNIFLVNNHLLFRGENPDSYASGAFVADLMDTGDPWYKLARALSIVGDKYHPQFPRFLGGYDVAGLKSVADTLNLTGTYMLGWRLPASSAADASIAKRQALFNVVRTVAESGTHEELDRNFVRLTGGIFGDEFERWSRDVTGEVDRSIGAFLSSGDDIVVHRVESPHEIALLVHKIAFEQLNRDGAFGDRVLIHYQVNSQGNVVLLLARGSGNQAIDVSHVCVSGPLGIRWGGGHKDRAGLGTSNVREAIAPWWGDERDPQRIIDFVLEGLRGRKNQP